MRKYYCEYCHDTEHRLMESIKANMDMYALLQEIKHELDYRFNVQGSHGTFEELYDKIKKELKNG